MSKILIKILTNIKFAKLLKILSSKKKFKIFFNYS